MAQCTICSSKEARSINVLLLTGSQISTVMKQFGFSRAVVSAHQRHHLPWRSRRAPKPETILEELEFMELELRRLTVLAECGQPIGGAIQALNARRSVLELRARLSGSLDATHKKLALAAKPVDYEVTFENGKMKTVEASK
jgi:hypothetical protein